MSVVHRTYARALYDAAFEAGGGAKARAVEAVLGESDPLVRNLLLLLVEKGRGAEVGEVAEEFERLVAAGERRLEVELTTALDLTEPEARDILAQIERSSGMKVEATRKVDPDLIGGVVLQIGSLRVDASVRG